MSEKQGIKRRVHIPSIGRGQKQTSGQRATWMSFLWESKAFLIAILVMSLIRLWMLHGLVIYPLVSAGCDDALLTNWALNLLGENGQVHFPVIFLQKKLVFLFILQLYIV